MERKKRTRILIEAGALMEKANLLHFSPAQLLGALLEIEDKSKNIDTIKAWENSGAQNFNTAKNEDHRQPCLVTFDTPPSSDVTKNLRTLGLRWNKFRQEWEGKSDVHQLKEIVERCGGKITLLDTKEA